MEFMGYRRSNGSVGTRNYVGVLATVVCANETAASIADKVDGAVSFTHQQGCCQTPVDVDRVTNTLIGLGRNPNLAAVLLVSLGCESTNVARVAEEIRASGKRVETIVVQPTGGYFRTVAEGALLVQDMVMEASQVQRTPCTAADLVLGLKCGSSDTTSGLGPNPALGFATDLTVGHGGSVVLGEVTEFIGAEHILARHAKDEAMGQKIVDLVARMEARAMSAGCDIRGGQPTGGNIKGGLTTIEEKSLGAIAKAGTAPIQAVYEYGEQPTVKGLVVMDSPGREPELLTGLASAGCNVICFTTGLGAPQGFPFVPVIKITGNERTQERLRDHIDLSVSGVIDGTETLPQAGQRIFDEMLRVANGKGTKAELSGYTRAMDIYMIGPVI
ncbi:MAG: UxaA family hydrolase [Desulfovibrionaceae bacterium]|jgi:altronate dehydratase large subunit|nr:UxaA family hydrolase [Desulfovibrionaceae bacterium]